MIREQLRDILYADPDVASLVGSDRISLTPPKRAASDDPDLAGYEPTPELFDSAPPWYLMTSIVLNPPYSMRDTSTLRPTSALARWVVALAYYTSPESEEDLALLSQYVGAAIDGKWIDVPGGLRGRVVVPHATSSVVPAPDLPGSGSMLLEDIQIAHVTR